MCVGGLGYWGGVVFGGGVVFRGWGVFRHGGHTFLATVSTLIFSPQAICL